MRTIGEARQWCSGDPECVLEEGHGGDLCEVVPGARALSLKREREAADRGVHPTERDRDGRAVVVDAKVAHAAIVKRDADVKLRGGA